MHEQPLDITPDLAIWVAIFAGAAAFVVMVIAAAIFFSRLRDRIAGNNTPRRTSATTWVAFLAIVAFLIGDVLAVLLPAIQAAKATARQSDATPASPPQLGE